MAYRYGRADVMLSTTKSRYYRWKNGTNVPMRMREGSTVAVAERTELARRIGATVREARRGLALDQSTVAALAGVSERFLRDLEHGKDTVQLRHLVAVFDAVGLELVVQPRTVRRSTTHEG